jgi:hypothetical protein
MFLAQQTTWRPRIVCNLWFRGDGVREGGTSVRGNEGRNDGGVLGCRRRKTVETPVTGNITALFGPGFTSPSVQTLREAPRNVQYRYRITDYCTGSVVPVMTFRESHSYMTVTSH